MPQGKNRITEKHNRNEKDATFCHTWTATKCTPIRNIISREFSGLQKIECDSDGCLNLSRGILALNPSNLHVDGCGGDISDVSAKMCIEGTLVRLQTKATSHPNSVLKPVKPINSRLLSQRIGKPIANRDA
ncbi:hypothetical protein WR25_10075 [Diploscapter pachys]|uniref:Uncharacterized protein n=1 Tax=Diploscapter pachys TaxID=2018661 RepID=A0A2A2JAJ0_9BILA|nr:hypothetical protein WR25_10075 [Diploscapter pachys]